MGQGRAAVGLGAFAPAARGKSARRLPTHLPPRHARRARLGKTRGPAARSPPAARGKGARRLARTHSPCGSMREERALPKPETRRRVPPRHAARARGGWPGRICPRGFREECAWVKPGARRRVCTAAWDKGARRLARTHSPCGTREERALPKTKGPTTRPPRLSQRAPDELLDCTRSFSARRERARTGRVAQRASGLARGCFIGAKRAASSDEPARTRKSGACAMSATGTLPAPLPSPAARGAGRVPLGFARPFPPEPRKGPRAICLLFRDFMLNFEEKF